jgi:hypothetical protein
MKNIKIIEKNIDVSKIVKQLHQYKEDWGSQKEINKTQQLDSTKYTVTTDVLQLIIGGVNSEDEYVGDTEICIKTPAYYKHTEVINFVEKRFKKLRRCAFLSLYPGEKVGLHIDEGTYYLTKDRYHLSIQGTYEYICGNEKIIVEPGTFFWFNNKLPHSATNIGNDVRITFVFDVPHHKKNPQNNIDNGTT